MRPRDFQATLLAIREVHKKLYLGVRESEVQRMMAAALSAAGFQDGECLTLFGGMSVPVSAPILRRIIHFRQRGSTSRQWH
jgi:hypothetical protein